MKNTEKMAPAEVADVLVGLSGGYDLPSWVHRDAARLRAHLDALELEHAEEIERWQEASGLERGGDPGGVRPEGLAKYLAKMEAEREESEELNTRQERELDSLRERVQALEAELQDAQNDARTLEAEVVRLLEGEKTWETTATDVAASRKRWVARAQTAETTLAGIRQRAGDVEGAWAAFQGGLSDQDGVRLVAGYILGSDAPAAPSGQEPGCAECPERADFVTLCCKVPRIVPTEMLDNPPAALPEVVARFDAVRTPEPSTAEDFATVRAGISPLAFDDATTVARAQDALLLLERRMGAKDAALRYALTLHHRMPGDVIQRIQAALTDAPEVFTLKEVEGAATMVLEDWQDEWTVGKGVRLLTGRLVALREKVAPGTDKA